MRSVITLGLGILIVATTPGLRAQANPSTPNSAKAAQGAGKPAQQPAKPAAPAATKPAAPAARPARQASKPAAPAAKPAGKPTAAKRAAKTKAKSPKRAVKAVEKPATPGTAPAAAESEVRQARRDPFESLLGRQGGKAPLNLPPGKLGLQVSTLRLDGIVRAPNGMIAVVSSPPSGTDFLGEGARL